jgi:cysteine desulfurase
MPNYYFDYAAATPLDPLVLAAMEPFFMTQFYNPSATYVPAVRVRQSLNDARAQVARIVGSKAQEIIFTAGGTESDNLAVHGIMQSFPEAECIVSAIEHDAVLQAAQKYSCHSAPVKPDGRVDLSALEAMISDTTVLVSIMYANNEIGTVQPLRLISQLLTKVRADRLKRGITLPIYFHSDACQAAGYLDLHVNELGVDLLTLNGGKIYGPKQSGILFVKTGVTLTPQIDGGGQEFGIRNGTENPAACIGFATALQLVSDARRTRSQALAILQQSFIKQVSQAIPSTRVNGSLEYRLPGNVHLTFPGTMNERLLLQLEQQGILAAAGSACSASDEAASHVLFAIGLSESEARSSIRFTMGKATTAADIEYVVGCLTRLIA